MKTLQELIDFALKHDCGELTHVALDVQGAQHWCGVPAVQDINGERRLILPTSNINGYRRLEALIKSTQTTAVLYVRNGDAYLPVSSIARGATPDGSAKALIVQV